VPFLSIPFELRIADCGLEGREKVCIGVLSGIALRKPHMDSGRFIPQSEIRNPQL
jgi:hypothetical protein